MTRRLDTIRIFSVRHGMALMEVDFTIPPDRSLPEGSSPHDRCFVPVAYFPKLPVAPDLEVKDAAGGIIAAPTKPQNMELTIEALECISTFAAPFLGRKPQEFALYPDVLRLAGDVIRKPPLDARACRHEMEKGWHVHDEWLLRLLRRLEDNFLLWVPLPNRPATEHRLSVRRSIVRAAEPVFPPVRFKKKLEVRTSVIEPNGSPYEFEVTWRKPIWWLRWFDPWAAMRRLLLAFGLMPVNFEHEVLDADRFSSYHQCLEPPEELVVREFTAGSMDERQWGTRRPVVHKLPAAFYCTVQGEDTRNGHMQLARGPNPSWVKSHVKIGLGHEAVTLWALVAVLTCGLLWAFHRDIQHIMHLAKASDRSTAVTLLLIGPMFASAWVLRERDRSLMRSMLYGTRLLLLASAALSVATALALVDIRPFAWPVGEAVSWYASLSYVVALPIAVGWLQTRGPAWSAYRAVRRCLGAGPLLTVALAAGSYLAISKLSSFPLLAALALFVAGFGFAVIAGKRPSLPFGHPTRLRALFASVGTTAAAAAAIVTLALAGRELYLFNYFIDRGQAHTYGRTAELAVATVALIVLVALWLIGCRARKNRISSEK